METIQDLVNAIKRREQDELIEKLREHGEFVDEGYEYHFECDYPIIAAYNNDEPCDFVVTAVRVDKYGILTILGHDKNDNNSCEIYVENIFAGHLSYVTSEIFYKSVL